MMKARPKLPEGFWAALAENNPVGMPLTEQDARDWFDMVWLRYSTYGYRRHDRAIINWWSRLSRQEIESVRERAEGIRGERENAELEARAKSESIEANVVRIDHFAKLRSNG